VISAHYVTLGSEYTVSMQQAQHNLVLLKVNMQGPFNSYTSPCSQLHHRHRLHTSGCP